MSEPCRLRQGEGYGVCDDEVKVLGVSPSRTSVMVPSLYAYLLYCEDRLTHQCHPSCRTIAAAVHLSAATVMKHITKLEDKQLIAVKNTNYIDNHGMKWNGNNLYTILPVQTAMDHCYQQQMLRLEEQQKRDHAQKRLGWNAESAPCAPV